MKFSSMKNPLILTNLQVHTEHEILKNASVVIDNGKIHAIHNGLPSEDFISEQILEFSDNYHLVPGFIDLHVHGAEGCDIMDATPEALKAISLALAKEGTTGYLATTMTASKKNIENALYATTHFMQIQHQMGGATLLGIHLEGPFISEKKLGAQSGDYRLNPDIEYIKKWQAISNQHIKLVTLAPELPNALEFITYLKQNNIIASIGHTNATYQETIAAINAGCSYATHLFNAMRAIHQREPGAITAALLSNFVTTELIADGIHLHPAIIKLALQLKTKDKIILVTDAMRAKCMCEGNYELGGQLVTVKNNCASLSDGTLAGSTLKMNSALKNMLHFTDCTLRDAIKMASENPAKMLHIFDRKGSIAVNKHADLVVLDHELNVMLTIVAGEIVYCSDSYNL